MNKTQLTTLLLALLVTGLASVFVISRGHHKSYLRAQTIGIGNDLIAKTNSERLVLIGPGLSNRLEQLLSSTTRIESVSFGDGTATTRLVLKNQQGEQLGIRLKANATGDKFNVLGFW